MKKVLIVEDEKDILEVIKIIFEDNNFIVTALHNGNNFIKTVKNNNPDIILVDMLLSGKNGSELVKQLREESSNIKNTPVIMLSAHSNAEEIAYDAGANAFIPKPFDIFDLIKKVKEVLEKEY